MNASIAMHESVAVKKSSNRAMYAYIHVRIRAQNKREPSYSQLLRYIYNTVNEC